MSDTVLGRTSGLLGTQRLAEVFELGKGRTWRIVYVKLTFPIGGSIGSEGRIAGCERSNNRMVASEQKSAINGSAHVTSS